MGNLWKGGKEETSTYQAKLFTASGTFVVPPDVGCLWIDGCGGGGGGGGSGNSAGGNGAPGFFRIYCLTVYPI